MGSMRKPGRRSQARSMHSLEPLEQRVLLNAYVVSETGDIMQNGVNLQNDINAATAGDTITIDAGVICQGAFTLPNKAFAVGSGTITIESSMLASLPVGVRVGPAQAALMPKIWVSDNGNNDSGGRTLARTDYQLLKQRLRRGR